MSINTCSEDVLRAQQCAKAAAIEMNRPDFDPGALDGKHGPRSERAFEAIRAHFGYGAQRGTLPPSFLNFLLSTWGAAVVPSPSSPAAAAPAPQVGNPSVVNGAFLWRATKLTTAELLALCRELRFSRVMPKIMNKHGKPMYARTLAKHIPAMQDAGIEVIPWAYLDDQRGRQDAETLAELAHQYDLTGAVANMEREVVDGDTPSERAHDAKEIDDVLSVLRPQLYGFVGLSTFRRRDYFPWSKEVFQRHGLRCTFMPQCYDEKTAAQSRKRVRECAESWLAWDLPIRLTLGAFPEKASKSGSFGSRPEGILAGSAEVTRLAAENPLVDPGRDWWTIEQLRHGYASQAQRDAVRRANEAAEGAGQNARGSAPKQHENADTPPDGRRT